MSTTVARWLDLSVDVSSTARSLFGPTSLPTKVGRISHLRRLPEAWMYTFAVPAMIEIPQKFGGSWDAFCLKWCPEGSLRYSAAEVSKGLTTLKRLWPERLAENVLKASGGTWVPIAFEVYAPEDSQASQAQQALADLLTQAVGKVISNSRVEVGILEAFDASDIPSAVQAIVDAPPSEWVG